VTTKISGDGRPNETKVRSRVKTLRVDRRDEGFTLVELMMTMIIAGILMAIGMFTFANYLKMSQQRGSAREVVSLFRTASERAISEGRTYCVDIAPGGRSTITYRYTCDPASVVAGTTKTQSAKVTVSAAVTNPSPPPACPTSHQCVYFYPRGTATPTTATIASTARAKTYTVTVEGLTARVYSPNL
jgi:prepilin-type N-terminal cleavage/methylation domain-containing protein